MDQSPNSNHAAVWQLWLALPASLAVIGVAIGLAFHTLPQMDDFGRSLRDMSTWSYVAHLYHDWSGRWFAYFLERGLCSNLPIFKAYPWLILGLMAADILGVLVFTRLILPAERRSPGMILFVGLLLAALGWNTLKQPGDSIYWFTGAIENVLPVTLGMLLFRGIGAMAEHRGSFTRPALAGLSVFTVILAGLHEVILFPLSISLGVGLLANWKRGPAGRAIWITLLIAAAIGFLIVYLAPGNAVRQKADGGPHSHEILRTLETGWRMGLQIALRLINPQMAALTILLLVSPIFQPTAGWIQRMPAWLRFTLPLFSLASALLVAMAYGWNTGNLDPPHRTATFIHLLGAIGWIASVMCWRQLGYFPKWKNPLRVERIAWLALAGSMLIFGNFQMGVRDLIERAGPWREAMLDRDAMLRRAAQSGTRRITVPQPPPIPGLLFNLDMLPGRMVWTNNIIAQYYGLEEVRLADTPPPITGSGKSR